MRYMLTTLAALALLTHPTQGQNEAFAKEDMGALGEDLKAAVIAELIPRDEAGDFYKLLAELQWRTRGLAESKDDREELRAARSRGAMTWSKFTFDPEDRRLDALLRPEFNRRDVAFLDAATSDQIVADMAETILDDYVRSFEDMRTSTLERLRAVRDHRRIEEASGLLEQIQSRRIDWADVDQKVDGWFDRSNGGKGGEAARDKTLRWLEERIVHLNDSIGDYEEIIASQRARLTSLPPGTLDEDPLLIANAARTNRQELRTAVEESLLAIAGPDTKASITAALNRVRIDNERETLRFTGGNVDLWQLLANLELEASLEERCLDVLRTEATALAMLFEERSEVAIARELRSLEFSVQENRPDLQAQTMRLIADGARREIRIELQIRERIRGTMDSIASIIEEVDAPLAATLRDAFRNAAFPAQMRRRWSERALVIAYGLSNIDEETLDALVQLEIDLERDLGLLRREAIIDTLRNEPKIAQAMIDKMTGEDGSVESLGAASWRESRHEDFTRLEDRQESLLRSILGPEGFAELPPRPGSRSKEPARADREKKRRDSKRAKGGSIGSGK